MTNSQPKRKLLNTLRVRKLSEYQAMAQMPNRSIESVRRTVNLADLLERAQAHTVTVEEQTAIRVKVLRMLEGLDPTSIRSTLQALYKLAERQEAIKQASRSDVGKRAREILQTTD